LPFSNVLPSPVIVAGNDIGLDILRYENNRFVSKGNLPGFSESSQFMAIDNNNSIWVAHPYRGVYKIDLNGFPKMKLRLYTDRNGLPSSMKNHLFKVKSHIVVATEKGIYEYNEKKDAFEASPYFKEFFGERNIRFLKEDADGNIWFIEEQNLGVVEFSGAKPQIIYFPELDGKMVSDFEYIYPYDQYNIFVGAEKGFYHINYEEYKKNSNQIQVRLRSVKVFGKSDSLLFGGYFGMVNEQAAQSAESMPVIASGWNSLHFEYSSPAYESQNSIEYSYLLSGFDKDWSAWSKKTEKEYTNLPAGYYSFEIKAKSNLGNESTIEAFSFSVREPWYLTSWTKAAYVLLILGLVFVLYKSQQKMLLKQRRRYEEEQKRLQYLHQLELEKSEKEIVKLRNEKLIAEIEHKNTELASAAMHLVQKGELLSNIREELGHLTKSLNGHGSPEEFKKMQRILSEENRIDKDWEQFASHFDMVHSDFLRILKLQFQSLSAHELKLCAYLRMNLSSKEIAQLENISVRGVEISRYRLRKKLKLQTETNLFDFLMQFPS
jgi:DNA-binding CsgD family transcriptional regulator